MVKRRENGQFVPGKSGNPKGRPTTQSSTIREKLMADHDAIIDVLRQAALGGDIQACKMILDRICPPLKAQATPVTIKLPRKADMTQIAEVIIKTAAEGALPPDIAAQLVAAVGNFARISEIKEDLPSSQKTPIFRKVRIELVNPDGTVKNLSDPDDD